MAFGDGRIRDLGFGQSSATPPLSREDEWRFVLHYANEVCAINGYRTFHVGAALEHLRQRALRDAAVTAGAEEGGVWGPFATDAAVLYK